MSGPQLPIETVRTLLRTASERIAEIACQRRRVVGHRRAGAPALVRRCLGRLHRDDPRRGSPDDQCGQPDDLGEADGVSRAGVPAIRGCLHHAACNVAGSSYVATRRCMVARGNGKGSRQVAGADGAIVRGVTGARRTRAHQADRARRSRWLTRRSGRIAHGWCRARVDARQGAQSHVRERIEDVTASTDSRPVQNGVGPDANFGPALRHHRCVHAVSERRLDSGCRARDRDNWRRPVRQTAQRVLHAPHPAILLSQRCEQNRCRDVTEPSAVAVSLLQRRERHAYS